MAEIDAVSGPAEAPAATPPVEPVAVEATTVEKSEPSVPLEPIPPHARKYETLVLVYSRIEGEALEAFIQTIKTMVREFGAVNVLSQNLGRRTLAYRVKDQADGVYVNFVYHAPAAAVKQIDRALTLNETVMRFLTTVEE